MKHIAITLASLTTIAAALTVPVAQDTFTSGTGKIAAASGKGVVLPVNAKQMALMRFDLGDPRVLPPNITIANLQSAKLRLYVVGAVLPANPADVTVHHVTTDWTEKFAGVPVAAPFISPAVEGAVHATELRAKNYVTIDVTFAVVQALNAGSFYGFAVKTADPKSKITFGSKEGAASGYGAELEIVANTALDSDGALNASTVNVSGTAQVSTLNAGSITASSGTFTSALNVSSAFVVEPRPSNAPTTPGSNIFIGTGAGLGNTTGSQNTFVGTSAGQAGFNGDATGNSFFGWRAGTANGGGLNSFFGAASGQNNSTGNNNCFFGYQSGRENTIASGNCYFGVLAGRDNKTGSFNTFFGSSAGLKNLASSNAFFGDNAGRETTTGSDNTFVGEASGSGNTTGLRNTFIGQNVGGNNTTENDNTYLGHNAGGSVGVTNATAIGSNSTVTKSNAVVLGDACDVGIRVTGPNSTLQVAGSLSLAVRTVNNSLLTGLNDRDFFVLLTGTLAQTVVLPQPGVHGRVYVVKNRTTQNATLTFQTAGPLIDGNPTLTLGNGSVVQLICDGTNWYRLNF